MPVLPTRWSPLNVTMSASRVNVAANLAPLCSYQASYCCVRICVNCARSCSPAFAGVLPIAVAAMTAPTIAATLLPFMASRSQAGDGMFVVLELRRGVNSGRIQLVRPAVVWCTTAGRDGSAFAEVRRAHPLVGQQVEAGAPQW